MRARRRGDAGVTIVEAAFALPVFLMFLFGLVDLGMWSMNSNQATNAARDGARVGILDHRGADDPGTDQHQAIVDAALAHLPAGTADASAVTVECVDPDGDPVPGRCAAARPDIDRIRVAVAWEWRLVTPIAGTVGTDRGAARGSATMLIVGLPDDPGASPVPTPTSTTTSTTAAPASTTSAPPPPAPTTSSTTTTAPCSASVTLEPSFVDLRNSDKPIEDLFIRVATTGGGCSDLAAQLVLPDGRSFDRALGTGAGPHGWQIGKNDISGWTTGTGTIRVLRGASVVGSRTFTVS